MTQRGRIILGAIVGLSLSSVVWFARITSRPSEKEAQAASDGYGSVADREAGGRIMQDAIVKRTVTDEELVSFKRLLNSPTVDDRPKFAIVGSMAALKSRDQRLKVLDTVRPLISRDSVKAAVLRIGTEYSVNDPTIFDGWRASADPALIAIADEATKAAKERIWLNKKRSG